MNQIPDDVWAGGWRLHVWHDGGERGLVAAFLVRAPTYEEALAKFQAIMKHDAKRYGARYGEIFMNNSPGELAVGTFQDGDPYRILPPDPAPDVTAEAKP